MTHVARPAADSCAALSVVASKAARRREVDDGPVLGRSAGV
jgi:hypothetical protein